ncbi:hypothetical protein WR25_06389 [Diploscapter pachys]|uniref:Uncharacterized protein n=1 Tax=Diploscapter pachys TaxID=2018661 RepID=A0A2A2LYT0_9BILA|nr:hypothetical protein WR25_06389 [Diploscapter pachys]
MSNLAVKFTGGSGFHVVDPNVDFRDLLSDESVKKSLEERNISVDLEKLKKEYDAFWQRYETWRQNKDDSTLKKAMREVSPGLVEVLKLPNTIHKTSTEMKSMLKPSKHSQYLAQQGLMRIEKETSTIHLVGYPALILNNLCNQLLDAFSDTMLISPSYFVRAAVLEGLNVDVDKFLEFTDSGDKSNKPAIYVVGNSLATLVSAFIKTQFSAENNSWPLQLQAIGPAYHHKSNSIDLIRARQRMKHTVLILAKSEDEMDGLINSAAARLAAIMQEDLDLDIKGRTATGTELHNYESQAIVIEERGLELARISRIGQYVPKRLNICTDEGYVHMAYVVTDLSRVLARIIDFLVDGKDPPKIIRKAIKEGVGLT